VDTSAGYRSSSAPARAPARPPPFEREHEELRAEIREFVASELRPHAREWEDARWFPNDVFGACAEQGYLGLKYPRGYGGLDRGYLADAVLSEELAGCGSAGVAAGIGAHVGIATPPVWKFGTDDQKQRYLTPAIRGEKIGALAITEPDAGSDVAGLRTRAERVDGGWIVRGAKTYITGGVRAGFYVTAVKTTSEGGHHGISFLIVDRQDAIRATKLDKLGWDASDTAELSFEEAWVPEENLLGQEHGGFQLIMANFQWERLLMALGAVGAMAFALERARDAAAPSGQATRHTLAELSTRAETCRALTYFALGLFVAGENAVREVTEAKLVSQRACFEVMDACLQLGGERAYFEDFDLQRAARDARLGPIGGGTDEIMKEILSRTL
jgi:acyl-CoA dehydrogenase